MCHLGSTKLGSSNSTLPDSPAGSGKWTVDSRDMYGTHREVTGRKEEMWKGWKRKERRERNRIPYWQFLFPTSSPAETCIPI